MAITGFWRNCYVSAVNVNHIVRDSLEMLVIFLTNFLNIVIVVIYTIAVLSILWRERCGGARAAPQHRPAAPMKRKVVNEKMEQSLSEQLAELEIDDIDLEKVVYDPEYRRAVIRRLNAAERGRKPDAR